MTGLVAFINVFEHYINYYVVPTDQFGASAYSRAANVVMFAKYFIDARMDVSPESLSSSMVQAMSLDMTSRREAKLSGTTIRTMLCMVRKVYRYELIPTKVVDRNPIRLADYPKQKPPRRIFTSPEDALRRALQLADGTRLGTRQAMMAALMAFTGLRRKELWLLRARDFRETDGRLGPHLIVEGKWGKRRPVPVCRPLVRLLRVYLPKFCKTPRAFLFHDKASAGLPTSAGQLQRPYRMKEAARKTRKVNLSPKAIRFGLATYLYERGLECRELQRLYDHSELKVTYLYVKRNERRTEAAVTEALPAFKAQSLEF